MISGTDLQKDVDEHSAAGGRGMEAYTVWMQAPWTALHSNVQRCRDVNNFSLFLHSMISTNSACTYGEITKKSKRKIETIVDGRVFGKHGKVDIRKPGCLPA